MTNMGLSDMMLNATFNNISVISQQSAVLVKENQSTLRKQPPQVTEKLYV